MQNQNKDDDEKNGGGEGAASFLSDEVEFVNDQSKANPAPPLQNGVFDGKKRPTGKWMIFSVATFVIAGAGLAFSISSNTDTIGAGDANVLQIKPSDSDVEIAGKTTEAYKEKVLTESKEKAALAEVAGKSYAASPIAEGAGGAGMVSPIPDAPKVTPEDASRQQRREQAEAEAMNQERGRMQAAMAEAMSQIAEGMKLEEQGTFNFKNEDDANEKNIAQSPGAGAIKNVSLESSPERSPLKSNSLPYGVHVGQILYATNDLSLNSDGKNPIVRATVQSGKLKGYVAMGNFDLGGDSLSLVFNRLISPDGEEYAFTAYGIDPSIPQANIASNVDNHYLSRWGGFVAGTFLQGFADATRTAGTTYSNGFAQSGGQGVGFGMSSIPQYSMTSKAIIATGNVGAAVANQLKSGLNRPATVTLNAGQPMGLLIINSTGRGS